MQTVYDVLDNGKKIPYLVTDETDIDDPEFEPSSGIPVQFNDVLNMDWNTLLIKLHNIYMDNHLYLNSDIIQRRKQFIELTKGVLVSDVLQYFIRG